MTVPLILLAIPSIFLGHRARRCPLGSGLIHQWLEPVFHEAQETLGHPPRRRSSSSASTALLILGSVRRSRVGVGPRHRRCSASSWTAARRQRPSGCERWTQRLRRSLPRLVQQVVVRRAQRPALRAHRRPGRRRAVVVRLRVIDGTVNGSAPSPRAGPRHPPHPDRPRPELRPGHRRRADRHRRLATSSSRADELMRLSSAAAPDADHVRAAASARW